jgi:hypothetical protein
MKGSGMKITQEEHDELSDLVLNDVRRIAEIINESGGWNKWTTGGMRMMTDVILFRILETLEITKEN